MRQGKEMVEWDCIKESYMFWFVPVLPCIPGGMLSMDCIKESYLFWFVPVLPCIAGGMLSMVHSLSFLCRMLFMYL